MTTSFELADGVEDWRVLGGDASAWFPASSHATGAALGSRVAGLPDAAADVDVRATGVRVRLRGAGDGTADPAQVEAARAISAEARELGLRADPAALQDVRLVVETATPDAARSFWREVLDYEPVGEHVLMDPRHRDPLVAFRVREAVPPLRNRLHLDVVRPPDAVGAVQRALARTPTGPFGVMIADDEGNEVDLVPGERVPGGADTEDWWAVFAGTAFYATSSPEQAASLAVAVANLADDAGIPLLVDVRPGGVTIDTGKDQWHPDVQPAFSGLAGPLQAAARAAGGAPARDGARFVQIGMDAVDVPATRAFWAAALGYVEDPRQGLTDLYDPRRFGPVMFFQDMEASDDARRRQRGRIHVELAVPHDAVDARVDAALAAGGRVVEDERPGRCVVADPEGNELAITARTDDVGTALP
ncbi:hypothetical protein Bcav_3824 [Beutenbergia cavernae DSM 12333]|uniref:Glyoxalase-like domain-containing protein n=1 Tax=Beutenbergia cavernae (strain ATCC BAA-8 / DSM 12333 / CCUG 43141 / JCM 11478 / NBRC 16432 / NCIMB 13614 / HKI 0122) TaxID=471853 RepID=C5C4E2_BEUC1|nr:VOC family protein [Beutenbergia cavernae]ACQ82066.1 hypothetical protein Bcav_3824 [Beutenbergia cavernae DSM 12333]